MDGRLHAYPGLPYKGVPTPNTKHRREHISCARPVVLRMQVSAREVSTAARTPHHDLTPTVSSQQSSGDWRGRVVRG